MTGKIRKSPVSKKLTMKEKIINKLRLKYPRLERNVEEAESIPPEEEKYYPPKVIGLERVRLSKSFVDEGYVKWDCTDLSYFIGSCLDQVVYRALKTVYGLPDALTCDIVKKDVSKNGSISATARPIEWGYFLQGKDGSCFELLNRFRDPTTKIILWLPHKKRPEEIPAGVQKALSDFLDSFYKLVEILDRDYSIKEEQEKARKVFGGGELLGVINLYYQNFQAGKEMIELSEKYLPEVEELHKVLFAKGQWDDAMAVFRKKNILYVSAIVFFLMALEGFVNLLYKFLLKPQYNYKEYERSTQKTGFDLRILHLPAYCKGFNNATITPDDIAYKQWLKIRPFRNNLLHANVTEENESITTLEDCFLFHYDPLSHLKKTKKKMHTRHFSMDKGDAEQVRQTVEQIVAEIIEKMDEKEKAWVNSWVGQVLITWFPGIEDKDCNLSN